KGDEEVAAQLAQLSSDVLLVINKMDLVPASKREQAVAAFSTLGKFAGVLPISAVTGEGVDKLLERLIEMLPPGPKYFPDDWLTDRPEQLVVGELIWEKAFMLTREEVPYGLAVVVERMGKRPNKDLVDIEATIFVESGSQKGIIIGN